MNKRVLILEAETGWTIFDAEKGDPIVEGLPGMDEGLRLCKEKNYLVPHRGEMNAFFSDLEGEPLFMTEGAKTGELELEYVDGTPCLDFELCPICKGPAFGRDTGGKNCYYCQNCDKDIDCVPPPEWIGEAD